MATAQAVETFEQEPRVVWEAFPSWAQFTWLYLLSALTALRGGIFFRFGVDGWEMWMVGATVLVACAGILRRWAHYELTSEHVTVRNGYTGREIQSIPLNDIGQVTVRQGIVAEFFGIGTVVIRSQRAERVLSFRGVSDPEDVRLRIEALAWRHNRTATS